MSKRADRGASTVRFVLAFVIILSVIAVAAFYIWSRIEFFYPGDDSRIEQTVPQQAGPIQQRPDRPVGIRIYYPEADGLAAAQIGIEHRPDNQSLAKQAVATLLGTPQATVQPVLREIKLRAFYMDSSGTAYVDLMPAREGTLQASAWDEILAVYAVVNTLMDNFEEIKAVRFLLNGREAQTLAGHIDLSGYFEKRTDLVLQ